MVSQVLAGSAMARLRSVLGGLALCAAAAGAAVAGDPQVNPVPPTDSKPIVTKQLELPKRQMVTLQAAPDETPQLVCVQLAAALEDEDIKALSALLAPGDLHCHLVLPGGRGEIGDDSHLYSAEQVFYMVREYFDRVEVVPYDQTTPGVLSPKGLVLTEVPELDESAHTEPHGILHFSVQAPSGGDPLHERLYIGLRRVGRGWRVEEIRQLP